MHQEKIFDQVWWFHGHKCAMSLVGAKAGLYLLDLLKAKREEAVNDLFAVVEDYSCMIDGLQYVAGTTIGNTALYVHHHFTPNVTIVRKSTGNGFKLVLKPEIAQSIVKARQERDKIKAQQHDMDPKEFKKRIKPFAEELKQLADRYTSVPYEEMFESEKVSLKWWELAKTPFTTEYHSTHEKDHTH